MGVLFLKKIILFLLVTAMLLNVSGFIAVAEGGAVNIVSEDFEGEDTMQFFINGAANGLCENPPEPYYTGKAYKTGSNSVLISSAFTPVYLFNDHPDYSEGNNLHNLYVETEFDVMPVSYAGNVLIRFSSDINTDHTSAAAISFDSSTKKIKLLGKNEKRIGSASYTELSDYKLNRTYRIKVVFHITDSTDVTCEEISDVLVDGVSTLPEPKYFATHSLTKLPYYNVLRLQNASCVYMDNISIKSYTSENGTSPVAERGALIKELREAYAYIYENENAEDKNGYSDDGIAQMKEYLKAADSVYADATASQSEINSAADAVKRVYDVPKENGGDNPGEEKIKYAVNQDFENETTEPIKAGSIQETDDPTTKHILRIEGGAQGISTVSEKFIGAGITTEDSVCYTDFDIKFEGLIEKGTSMRIKLYKDTTPDGTCISQMVFDGANGKIQLIHSTNKFEDITSNGFLQDGVWYGMRIVFHTSSAPMTRRPTISIYINGECIADKMYTQSYSDKASEYNTMAFVGLAGQGTSLCLDNLKIYKIAENDTAVPQDRAKMNSVMRRTNDFLKTAIIGVNEGEYSEDDYNRVKEQYTKALEKYNAINTQVDIDAIYNMLNPIIESVKPNGKAIFVNPPSADKTNLSGDTVKIKVKITTGKSLTTERNIYIICALKENDDIVQGSVCRKVQAKKVLLKTDSETECEFDIQLAEYQSRDNLYVSVSAIDDFENLNGITAVPYYLFKTPAEYDADTQKLSDDTEVGYEYTNDIAVSEIKAKTDKDNQINIAVFNENGEIVGFLQNISADGENAILKIVSEGAKKYTYVVKTVSGEVKKGDLYHADAENLNSMFTELYSSKNNLSEYAGYLGIDTDIYASACSAGVSTGKIFDEISGNKKYTAADKNIFAELYNKDAEALTNIRTAVNTDTVIKNIAQIGIHLSEYARFTRLGNAAKQNAAEYVYRNRLQVADNTSLNSLMAKAIKENYSNPAPSGDSSGTRTSGGSSSGTYSHGNVIVTQAEETKSRVPEFLDVPEEHWVHKAVSTFSLLKFIEGTSDMEFSPDANIKREDFIKICVSAFGIYDDNSETSFKDVSKNDYFYKYVASAIANGLVQGQSENTFGAGLLLTRQDMAVIVYRLCQNIKTDITDNGIYIPFSDETIFADYAKEAIIYLARSGIVNGRGNNLFAPKDYCTRAEAVKMLYELYGRRR